MSKFEELYRIPSPKWGFAADRFLAMNLSQVPQGRALDLGCGDGRNVLYLAKQGFNVVGVDFSRNAILKLLSFSTQAGLKHRVNGLVADFRFLPFVYGQFNLIVAAGSLVYMKKAEAFKVIWEMKRLVTKEGCVYIGGFTIDDPSYKHFRKERGKSKDNSYYIERLGCFQFWFAKTELKKLFDDFKVIDYREVFVSLPSFQTDDAKSMEHRDFEMCLIFAKKI